MRDDSLHALLESIGTDLATITKPDTAWWARVRTWATSGYKGGGGNGRDTSDLTIVEAAATRKDHTALLISGQVDAFDRAIRSAAKDLRIAAIIVGSLNASGGVDDDVQGCRSCVRNGNHFEPAVRFGLCDWCATYRTAELKAAAEHGFTLTDPLPPVALLRIRHTGGRVTGRDIARHRPARARLSKARR